MRLMTGERKPHFCFIRIFLCIEKISSKMTLLSRPIKFNLLNKPNANSIEENNTMLWAKQIFKTKPNHELDSEFKNKIKTVFHHLTKEELIEKLIANYILQNKQTLNNKQ